MKSISLFFLLTTSSLSAAMTCTDANHRTMVYNQSSDSAVFTFANLDTSGIPSGVPYSTHDTGYVSVPGAPPYSEYTIDSGTLHLMIQLTEGESNPTAKVWTKFTGMNPSGNPVFQGKCDGGSSPQSSSELSLNSSRAAAAFQYTLCESAAVQAAQDKIHYEPGEKVSILGVDTLLAPLANNTPNLGSIRISAANPDGQFSVTIAVNFEPGSDHRECSVVKVGEPAFDE